MPLEGDLDVDLTDEGVEFTFSVTNADTEPHRLDFRSGKFADVVVYADVEVVWRWSDGRMFAQALQSVTLAPGETFVRTATWPTPDPGHYVAVGELEATNADVEARAEFEV